MDAAGRQPVAQLVIVGRDGEDHAHPERPPLGSHSFDHRLERLCLDRTDRPAVRAVGQHVRAVEFAGDHPVEQDLPVRLRLQRDIEALVIEEALLGGDGQRRHVGELYEAELQLVLFDIQHSGDGTARRQQHRCDRRRGDPAPPDESPGLAHMPLRHHRRSLRAGARSKKNAADGHAIADATSVSVGSVAVCPSGACFVRSPLTAGSHQAGSMPAALPAARRRNLSAIRSLPESRTGPRLPTFWTNADDLDPMRLRTGLEGCPPCVVRNRRYRLRDGPDRRPARRRIRRGRGSGGPSPNRRRWARRAPLRPSR